MEPHHYLAEPFTAPELVQNDRFYLQLLHGLLKVGATVAEDLPAQARRQPAFDPADAFDRVSRAMRRTILLARSLAEPPPRARRSMPGAATPAPQQDQPRAERAEPQERPERRECIDRLDAPDRLDDVSGALPEVIAAITRDLGIPAPPPAPPMPQAAAQPAAPAAEGQAATRYPNAPPFRPTRRPSPAGPSLLQPAPDG